MRKLRTTLLIVIFESCYEFHLSRNDEHEPESIESRESQLRITRTVRLVTNIRLQMYTSRAFPRDQLEKFTFGLRVSTTNRNRLLLESICDHFGVFAENVYNYRSPISEWL